MYMPVITGDTTSTTTNYYSRKLQAPFLPPLRTLVGAVERRLIMTTAMIRQAKTSLPQKEKKKKEEKTQAQARTPGPSKRERGIVGDHDWQHSAYCRNNSVSGRPTRYLVEPNPPTYSLPTHSINPLHLPYGTLFNGHRQPDLNTRTPTNS